MTHDFCAHVREAEASPPPDPVELRVVAGLFVFFGACAVIEVIVGLFQARVSLNLGVLSLWIGLGLFRRVPENELRHILDLVVTYRAEYPRLPYDKGLNVSNEVDRLLSEIQGEPPNRDVQSIRR